MSDRFYKIIQGDVRESLATIPAGSVQMCVTSPPYWGLRDYGTAQWDGGDAGCDHFKFMGGTAKQGLGKSEAAMKANVARSSVPFRDTCGKCGAKRIDRQIGQEPTPDAYVQTMVEVFREVRRVLHDSGTVWLNLGDTYAANRGYQVPDGKWRDVGNGSGSTVPNGLKPKDLCMIPWRVALALQADGWWLRSVICWAKKSCMPESVTDRPTNSWEPIFLLAKSHKYFYDAEAVKEKSDRQPHVMGNVASKDAGHLRNDIGTDAVARVIGNGTRNQRNVWHLGPEPYAEAHFATFPTEIPRRAILAGSRPGDTVLDPFNGSGTSGQVAVELGRYYIGCELNPEYIALAHKRIGTAIPPMAGMFA